MTDNRFGFNIHGHGYDVEYGRDTITIRFDDSRKTTVTRNGNRITCSNGARYAIIVEPRRSQFYVDHTNVVITEDGITFPVHEILYG